MEFLKMSLPAEKCPNQALFYVNGCWLNRKNTYQNGGHDEQYFCSKAMNFWGVYVPLNPLLTDVSEKNCYEEISLMMMMPSLMSEKL